MFELAVIFFVCGFIMGYFSNRWLLAEWIADMLDKLFNQRPKG